MRNIALVREWNLMKEHISSSVPSKHFYYLFVMLAIFVSIWLPHKVVYAADQVRIGVLSVRPKPQTLAQWQPLAIALKQAMPEYDFTIEALTFPELEKATSERRLDFVLTNPAHYILLDKRYGLSSVLATLAFNQNGKPSTLFGGVIFSRTGQVNVERLPDVEGKTVAISSNDSMGGYQSQAYELKQAGVNLPQDAKLEIVGMPQDNVVNAVLSGKAEVGFVRTGILEAMVSEGKLDAKLIKVINAQSSLHFPVQISTRSYPEWAFSALPNVDNKLIRHVTSALLLLAENTEATRVIDIYGFNAPADYTSVVNLLKELRIAPFDSDPEFTLRYVWQYHPWKLVGALIAIILIVARVIQLLLLNRKLSADKLSSELRRTQLLRELEFQKFALDQHSIVSISDANGKIIYANSKLSEISQYSNKELIGQNHRLLNSGYHSPDFFEGMWATISNGMKWHGEIKNRRKDGSYYWADSTIVPFMDDQGNPQQYISIRTDITAHKEAETALKKSAAYLNGVLNSSQDAIIGIDENGLVLEFNPAAETIFGYHREQVMHKKLFELIIPYAMRNRYEVEDRLNSLLGQRLEIVAQRANGEEFPVELTISKQQASGRTMFTSTLRDLSERKATEVALHQSQQYVHQLLHSLSEGAYGVDLDGNCTFVNPAFLKILGYQSEDELLGKHIHTLTHHSHQDGSDYPAIECKMYQAFINKQSTHVTDEVFWRKDGAPIPVEYWSAPILADGELIGAFCTFIDITERKNNETKLKENELQLQYMLETSPISVRIKNELDGKLVFVNQSYVDMFHTTRESAIGSDPTQLYSNIEDYQYISNKLEEGDPVSNHLVELVAINGEVLWVLASFYKFEYMGMPSTIGWFYDVTALTEARQSADRANQAKSEFLSNMSHELRTPMNAVLGFAQILEYDSTLDADQQDSVHEIIKGGRHLLKLINEILDLAKVESGHIDLSLEPVDITLVVNECLALVGTLADKAGVEIKQSEFKGAMVRADRTRLKQVLLNLLSNAIKYNREHGSINLDIRPEGEGRLRILVTDTGLGIANEQLNYLFQPFNRLSAEHSGVEGTGIGLTIAKRIVEMMAGTIGVESEVGIGSTFWIELPLESSLVPDITQQNEVESGSELNVEALPHTHSILYIDDNPINLKLVTQMLSRRKNIYLFTAQTPELGLELAYTHQPELILLDINMPGMDGYQVLEILKSDQKLKSKPVIAVTANAMPRDVKRGLAAGFTDYLAKPLDVEVFLKAIDHCLVSGEDN